MVPVDPQEVLDADRDLTRAARYQIRAGLVG
jgi:hypothetical protein